VPLNKKRWERFSLTEFWSFALSALVGLIVYMQSGWNTPLAMVALFLVATLVGFGIGLFNVVRNQRKDREEVHKPPVPAKKPA
jgi:F0F1-type ATP synthase assembly protein I